MLDSKYPDYRGVKQHISPNVFVFAYCFQDSCCFACNLC